MITVDTKLMNEILLLYKSEFDLIKRIELITSKTNKMLKNNLLHINISGLNKAFQSLKSEFILDSNSNILMSELLEFYKCYMTTIIDLNMNNMTGIDMLNYDFSIDGLLDRKNIIIYGAGRVGKSYYNQFKKLSNINVVAIVDTYEMTLSDMVIKKPEELQFLDYDLIIIAVMKKGIALEIKNNLVNNFSIDISKIVWEAPNNLGDVFVFD